MKEKEVVTKDNYKEIVLKRAIILCWVLLITCFVVKIFGGNFFNIVCENERFIKLCEYIDGSVWYYIVAFIFYFVSTAIYVLTISKIFNINKYIILIILSCLICFASKFISLTVGLAFDFIFMYFIVCYLLCILNKLKWKTSLIRTFVGFLLNNLFQIISLFVKNLGLFKIMNNCSFIQIIFSLDYYIMLIIFYLYEKQKMEV